MKEALSIRKYLLCLSLLLFLVGCKEQTSYKFLFVGHAYDWSNWKGDTVDPRLERMNLDRYDGIWLGGDVCANTSLNPKTMQYLDRAFDLDNPLSHFVLGNHDYRDNNIQPYFDATGRQDFYTSRNHNLVVSVLNTNLNSSNCHGLDAQYEMLMNVCDTITSASHYVLLMHHQIFENIPGAEAFRSNGVCKYYAMNCGSNNSYFKTALYPRLVELEKKGIEVVIVVGDSGWHKGSEEESVDGVTFLSSGINNTHYIGKDVDHSKLGKDKVLVFDLDTEQRQLTWSFVELGDLVYADPQN